jgi:hypothetical protein
MKFAAIPAGTQFARCYLLTAKSLIRVELAFIHREAELYTNLP